MTHQQDCLVETVLLMDHRISFYGEKKKNYLRVILNIPSYLELCYPFAVIIPPAYEVCHGGIMFSSFLCVCVCVSVNNFRVRSITLKPLDIFS